MKVLAVATLFVALSPPSVMEQASEPSPEEKSLVVDDQFTSLCVEPEAIVAFDTLALERFLAEPRFDKAIRATGMRITNKLRSQRDENGDRLPSAIEQYLTEKVFPETSEHIDRLRREEKEAEVFTFNSGIGLRRNLYPRRSR